MCSVISKVAAKHRAQSHTEHIRLLWHLIAAAVERTHCKQTTAGSVERHLIDRHRLNREKEKESVAAITTNSRGVQNSRNLHIIGHIFYGHFFDYVCT